MIHLESEYLKMVQEILVKYIPQFEVRAFGSRVHGENLKKYSDLDLAIMTDSPMELSQLGELKEAFSESNIPIKVDLLDWSSTSENFQKIILQSFEVIQTAPAK